MIAALADALGRRWRRRRMRRIFTGIYHARAWGDYESVSGLEEFFMASS